MSNNNRLIKPNVYVLTLDYFISIKIMLLKHIHISSNLIQSIVGLTFISCSSEKEKHVITYEMLSIENTSQFQRSQM